MKFRLLILFCLIPLLGYSQVKLEHGLILGGGSGTLSNLNPQPNITPYQSDYQFNVGLGYKFRLTPGDKKFFYDLDVNLGMKNWSCAGKAGGYGDYSYGDTHFYASLSATFNYKLWKGLYVGAGIEPTIYNLDYAPLRTFDIPVKAQIGYNFKFVEVAFSYRQGLCNIMKDNDVFNKAKVNDWQFSLFIPF